MFLCLFIGFLTFGFQRTLCVADTTLFPARTFKISVPPHTIAIHGIVYDISSVLSAHAQLPYFASQPLSGSKVDLASGLDVSPYFPPTLSDQCRNALTSDLAIPCASAAFPGDFQFFTDD